MESYPFGAWSSKSICGAALDNANHMRQASPKSTSFTIKVPQISLNLSLNNTSGSPKACSEPWWLTFPHKKAERARSGSPGVIAHFKAETLTSSHPRIEYHQIWNEMIVSSRSVRTYNWN